MPKRRVAKNKRFPCSVCGSLFSTLNKAQKHVEQKHPVQVKFFTRGD